MSVRGGRPGGGADGRAILVQLTATGRTR